MSKKTKKSRKSRINKKLLKEIAERLKQIQKTGEDVDESELEKDVEISKNSNLNLSSMDFNQFVHFMHSAEDAEAPVLERIAGQQAGPRFIPVGRRDNFADAASDSGPDGTTYLPGQNQNNEPKYIQSGGEIKSGVERVDMMKAGRDIGFQAPRQETFFMRERESEAGGFEKINNVGERIDIEKAGRGNPNEVEERKYEKKYEFK